MLLWREPPQSPAHGLLNEPTGIVKHEPGATMLDAFDYLRQTHIAVVRLIALKFPGSRQQELLDILCAKCCWYLKRRWRLKCCRRCLGQCQFIECESQLRG